MYTVVLDAGSTGTRVSIFPCHQGIVISGIKTLKVRYPITAFVNGCMEKLDEFILDPLLSFAHEEIPSHLKEATKVSLLATGGLRMFLEDNGETHVNNIDQLFQHIQDRIISNGFSSLSPKPRILSGADEAGYAWIATQYVLRKGIIDKFRSSLECPLSYELEPLFVLDIGGISTQASYPILYHGSVQSDQDMVNWKVPLSLADGMQSEPLDYLVRQMSFDGYGLEAVRNRVARYAREQSSAIVMNSSCFPLDSVTTIPGDLFNQKNTKGINLRGSTDVSLDNCIAEISRAFDGTYAPPNLPTPLSKVVLLSAFIDVSKYFLRDPDMDHMTLHDLVYLAECSCAAITMDLLPNFKDRLLSEHIAQIDFSVFYQSVEKDSFLCIDFSWFVHLLRDIYNLPLETDLVFIRRPNSTSSYELSWTLGRALLDLDIFAR
jgi:hypothetical protein